MAKIFYHDIGDYLTQEEKLKKITQLKSFGNPHFPFIELNPNEHGDWISLRNDAFENFIPIISEGEKIYSANSKGFFLCVSGSVISSRDAWCFNFSKQNLKENIQKTIEHYNQQRELIIAEKTKEPIADSKKGSWSQVWLDLVKKNYHLKEETEYRISQYRPFTKTNTYFGKDLNARRYQLPKFFPNANMENLTICVTGKSLFSFSVLVTNKVSEFGLLNGRNGTTQCFPLYYYEENTISKQDLYDKNAPQQYTRKDAISDFILEQAHQRYGTNVSKEDIFYYVYGFLHSKDYRETFANDLKKMLPRLPLVESVKDFWAFSQAGKKLAHLHLHYETIEPYPNLIVLYDKIPQSHINKSIEGKAIESIHYEVEKMRFAKKDQKDTILYNAQITIDHIPEQAYEYVVNGKSAIEWIMERYQISTHKESGITNNPNDWASETGNPKYILNLLLSVINVSMQTVEIVNNLPKVKFD